VLILLAGIVVAGFGVFLIGLAVLAFVRPALVERFIGLFASSARAHYTEQAFRLLIGASMVMLAPATWQSGLFLVIGWMIAGTAVGLMLIPWRWHWRFGTWVMPAVLRHMELYAAGLFAFGVFLLSGVFWRA
jgi:hypothetical protein